MRKITWLLALAVPVTIISCQKDAVQELSNEDAALVQGQAVTGNGGPSGAHYNLNIIGVPKDKTASMTNLDNGTGGRIFVSLNSKGSPDRIMLKPAPEGEDFRVLDANGTDGRAEFQLPRDVSANWNVFARVPGNQSGSVKITTCAEYAWDGTPIDITLCSSIDISRQGYEKFTNVSDDLLYVTLSAPIINPTTGEEVVDAGTYPLFDDRLVNYFWEYDNSGLKLLQLRFYPKSASTN